MEKSNLVIEVSDLHKDYRLGKVIVPALCGVSLKIERGEFVSIMGHSGSGKSTLMNLIGCLDTPTSGKIILDSVDYTGLDDAGQAKIRSGKIGFVFQTFNLLPTRNIVENVKLPLVYTHKRQEDVDKKISELLKSLGLESRANHLPNELSVGERQRVAMARALINDPAIVLADEPTGNMDTKTSWEIMKILVDLNEKLGVTIVLVTHEEDISAFSRRKIVLRDGKIISDEPLKSK